MVASPAYLEKAGVPRTPADLVRHNGLRCSRVSAAHEWRFRGPGGAMLKMACAGVGIAMPPSFLVADALQAGKLVMLLDDVRHGMAGIHLVYPTAPTQPPKTSIFVDHMAKGLRVLN